MSKILFPNDPHIADHPPAGRIDDYAASVLAKLEEIRQMAVDMAVDAVVFTGDIFHQKRANRVSHRLVNRLINHFQDYPPGLPVLTVLGNHDLSPEGVAGVQRQPIWTLHEAMALQIMDQPLHIGDDVCLVPRPWDSVRAADPDYYKLTDQEKKDCAERVVVLVAHGPILAPSAQRIYDSFSVDEMDLDGIDAVICGHVHEDQGIHAVGRKKAKHFAAVGSIARTSRTVANMARTPAVVLLETTGDEAKLRLTRHGLKSIRPIGEVFEGQPLDVEEGLNEEMAAFVEGLTTGLRTEDRDIHELLAELGLKKGPVLDLVLSLLEEGGLL